MQGSFKILNEEEHSLSQTATFALDVLNGLSGKPKTIPSKYLYDEIGSKLFEEITKLKEYYPTQCETEILQKRKKDIFQFTSEEPFRLVELGSGDAHKTKVLLKYFLEKGLTFEYVLVDCCKEMVQQTIKDLKKEFKDFPLNVIGLPVDYSSALAWLKGQNNLRTMTLFLGSSIGNFELQQTEKFLNEMWDALNDGDCVFIGFDLKKNIETLNSAYNDKTGVTREFNLNLLDRMNRELEANFDRKAFIHHSFYNPAQGRMESWIVSSTFQTVTIGKLQKSFDFEPWEGIHVENSYKFSLKEIEHLAEKTGFVIDKELLDSKGYFTDAILQVKKSI